MLDSLWGLDETKRVLIISFWWHWWNHRNKVREGELRVHVTEIARWARCDALEYEQVFSPAKPKRPPEQWQLPTADTTKFNLDGAFTPGNSFSGWGVVAHNSSGQVVIARAGWHEQVHDAFGAEVNALATVVTIAAELEATRVSFETDSELLADAMDIWRVDASPYAAIIEDIKFQLRVWFSKWSVSACRRTLNMVVHELAQIGCKCSPNVCVKWDTIVPPSVADCILGDMPGRR
ncbi:Glutamyl-tRNA reductase 1, chloroplastic [Hordeum vulgare]|nr:Glutamyl-tRNA reductase 1, chloroplastic [Hordeum vulgare]